MSLTKFCCCINYLKGVKVFGSVMVVMTLISFISTFFLTIDEEKILWYQLFGSVAGEPGLVITLILIKECHDRKVLRVW